MVESEDSVFKLVAIKHLIIMLKILHLGISFDYNDIEILSAELTTIQVRTYRPDFIARIGNKILMLEFQSTPIRKKDMKRFSSYISLYHNMYNDDDLEIVFFIVSTVEPNRIHSFKFNHLSNVKFPVISRNHKSVEKIFNRVRTNIKNNTITDYDVIELAMVPMIPLRKNLKKSHFIETAELLDKIPDIGVELKNSAACIVLALADMYIGEDGELKNKLEAILMKGNYLQEIREESEIKGQIKAYNEIISEGMYTFNDLVEKFNLPDDVIRGLDRG